MNLKPRRIIVCIGDRCTDKTTSNDLYDYLIHLLNTIIGPDQSYIIQHSTTHCMGICYDGPILVIHPDKIWYQQVDKEGLERIVREHILNDQPVAEYMMQY